MLFIFCIVLDPAGHVGHVGRFLSNGYERGATFRLAQELRRAIARDNTNVLLTREAGEHLEPYQAVVYANQAAAHLFMRLHIYRSESPQPVIHLYHRVIDPLADFAARPLNPHAFVAVDYAHRVSIQQTRYFGNLLCHYLQRDEYKRLFLCEELQGVPLVALKGLVIPGLLVEIGIRDEEALNFLVDPLAKALKETCCS